MRKTKIVCTLGPSCDSGHILREMIRAGMNIARLNMAHGELDEHRERIRKVREAAENEQAYVPVLMDIKGPEVRIGKLKEDFVELVSGADIILTTEQILGDSTKIPVNYEEMPKVVKPNSRILIDDGLIELKVKSTSDHEILCSVVNGGKLKPRKGVNLPGVHTTLPGVTERDVKHVLFGIENGIEIIAMSFVRKAEDILELREILKENHGEHIQIISKIENDEGVANLDAIIEASDGIMVARGDLGVEIPVEEVPLVQKEIVEKCNAAGKPVIVATHMLDSMQVNPRPTRAEVSDVSAAVLQGADLVMLSGESAAGKYPVESVRMMATIAEKAESVMDYTEQFNKRQAQHGPSITEVISQAAVRSTFELDAKAILTPTESGFTARMVSKYRPKAPIIAITQHPEVIRKLCLLWGVIPVLGEPVASTDEMLDSAMKNSLATGIVRQGDYVVMSAGVPIGRAGTTNLIRIEQV
ncbi:pyruvate kinase [Paenibacillus turpanensis]|uniref:pyruvate kinase n=1 Tax=Paenibacillus turpanensis TaxID=2689078 RepID=UPI00140DB55B|nr:pyruvate kinase [Paenibacillus turpanensis]